MNKIHFNSVAELLPHTGEMILIDEVTDWNEEFLEARVQQNRPHWYTDANGNTPAWVGLEYMAQTIGALAGIKALSQGDPIRIGFLLGTRKYQAHVPYFKKNTPITIRVENLYLGENNLALFDCTIRDDHKVLAHAQIKAIQPDNIEDVIDLPNT